VAVFVHVPLVCALAEGSRRVERRRAEAKGVAKRWRPEG
jgi:hypothetical protein